MTAPIHTEDRTWVLVRRFGYAGLLPFVFLALCLWVVDEDLHPHVALSMQAYGGVIVSFLGGLHWGIGLRNAITTHQTPPLHLLWGVLLTVLAWVGVMMSAFAGLPLLGFVLIGCYIIDRKTWPAAGLAPWLPMRLHLTLISSLSCFLAAGAT